MEKSNIAIKVSIVVPIYNCENFLERCIESLINQTLKDIEIILVNDGSTDRSGEICDMYSQRDMRIIVLHKTNGGLSDARNYGINASRGDFIGFVDADDFVDITMFEKLYYSAYKNNCEVSICNYYRYFSIDKCIPSLPMAKQGIYDGRGEILLKFIGNKLSDFEQTFHLASVCRCLYSKILIKNIKFSPIRTVEDRLFNIEVLLKANKIYYLSEPLYFYFFNQNSITTTYDSELPKNLSYSHKKVFDLFKNVEFDCKEELYTSKLIHYKSVIRNEVKNKKRIKICESVNLIKKFGEIVDLNDDMFHKAQNNMSRSNKIIYHMLKYDLIFFVLLMFKIRSMVRK